MKRYLVETLRKNGEYKKSAIYSPVKEAKVLEDGRTIQVDNGMVTWTWTYRTPVKLTEINF
jgi:hypothetical protein